MTTAQWNTGRQYTVSGQRIRAEMRDGMIYFRDFDRQICGEFPYQHGPMSMNPKQWLTAVTMGFYDNSKYSMSLTAMNLKWEE